MFGGNGQTRTEAEWYFRLTGAVPRNLWPSGVDADALIWEVAHPEGNDLRLHVWLEHRLAFVRACVDLFMEWTLGDEDHFRQRLTQYRTLRDWMSNERIGAPDWVDPSVTDKQDRITLGEYCVLQYGRSLLRNLLQPDPNSTSPDGTLPQLENEFWPSFRIRVAAILEVAGAAATDQIWARHTPTELAELEESPGVQGRRCARRFTQTYFTSLLGRRLSQPDESRLLSELPTYLSWCSDRQLAALSTFGLSLDLTTRGWLQAAQAIRSKAQIRSSRLVSGYPTAA